MSCARRHAAQRRVGRVARRYSHAGRAAAGRPLVAPSVWSGVLARRSFAPWCNNLTPRAAKGDAAHTAASGSCVLSGFHARDSECVAPLPALLVVNAAIHCACARDALKALRTLLGRIPETAGARQAASAAALPASFAAAAGDALAALAVLSPGDPDAPPRTQARTGYSVPSLSAC